MNSVCRCVSTDVASTAGLCGRNRDRKATPERLSVALLVLQILASTEDPVSTSVSLIKTVQMQVPVTDGKNESTF